MNHKRSAAVFNVILVLILLVGPVAFLTPSTDASHSDSQVDVFLSDSGAISDDAAGTPGPFGDHCETRPFSLVDAVNGDADPPPKPTRCIQLHVGSDSGSPALDFAIAVDPLVDGLVSASIRDGVATNLGVDGTCNGEVVAEFTWADGPSSGPGTHATCVEVTIDDGNTETTYAIGRDNDGIVAHIQLPRSVETDLAPVLRDDGNGLEFLVTLYVADESGFEASSADGYTLFLQRDCGPLQPLLGPPLNCAGEENIGDQTNTLQKTVDGDSARFTDAELGELYQGQLLAPIHLWLAGPGLVQSNYATSTDAILDAWGADAASTADTMDRRLWQPVLLERTHGPIDLPGSDGFFSNFEAEPPAFVSTAGGLSRSAGPVTMRVFPWLRDTQGWQPVVVDLDLRLLVRSMCVASIAEEPVPEPPCGPLGSDDVHEIGLEFNDDEDRPHFAGVIDPSGLPEDFWIEGRIAPVRISVLYGAGENALEANYIEGVGSAFDEVALDAEDTERSDGTIVLLDLLDRAATVAFTPVVFLATPSRPVSADGLVADIRFPDSTDIEDAPTGRAPTLVDHGDGLQFDVDMYQRIDEDYEILEGGDFELVLAAGCGEASDLLEGLDVECSDPAAETATAVPIVDGTAFFESDDLDALFGLPRKELTVITIWVASPELDPSYFSTVNRVLFELADERGASVADAFDADIAQPVILLRRTDPDDLRASGPVVGVTTKDASGSEQGADPVSFEISVDGQRDVPVEVRYRLDSCFDDDCVFIDDDTVAVEADEPATILFTRPNDDILEPVAETIKLTLVEPPVTSVPIGADVEHASVFSRRYAIDPDAAEASATITDAPRPTVTLTLVSPAGAQVWEDGATNAVVRLTRSNVDATRPLRVLLATSGDDTATASSDYSWNVPAFPVTIPANAPTLDLVLNPAADILDEPDETVTLALLANPNLYVADLPQAVTITILDDDDTTAAAVSLAVATGSTNHIVEGGATAAELVLVRTVPPSAAKPAIAVAWEHVGQSGAADVELRACTTSEAIPDTITIPAGVDVVTLCVHAVDDGLVEENEQHGIRLKPGSGYSVTTPQPVHVVVEDNEVPRLSITATDAAAGPDADMEGLFTVHRHGRDTTATIVQFTRTGTASASEFDFFIGSTELTGSTFNFPASADDAPLEIRVVPVDGTPDAVASETIIVTLVDNSAFYDLDDASSAYVRLYDQGLVVDTITPAVGSIAGGTIVTVRGNGFPENAQVYFGTVCTGTAACATRSETVEVVSATELTTEAPPHAAGTVPLLVRAGDLNSNTVNFVYVNPPAITSLSPTSGPSSGGTVVEIRGTGFTTSPTVRVDGVLATITSATDSLVRIEMPPHHAGSVPITLTTVHGLSATRSAAYTFTSATSSSSSSSGSTGSGTTGSTGSGEQGNTNTASGTTGVSDTSELIYDVVVAPGPSNATISWKVDDPGGATAYVTYGVSEPLAGKASSQTGTSFATRIHGLAPDTTFRFEILAQTAGGKLDTYSGTFQTLGASALGQSVGDVPRNVREGDTINFTYSFPEGIRNPRLQVVDSRGQVVAEVPLVQNATSGLWEASVSAPLRGEYAMRIAYSTASVSSITAGNTPIRSYSTDAGAALRDEVVPISLAVLGSGSLIGVAAWVIRRRIW